MKNLAHSASFESFGKDAPSKPGTKHLAPASRYCRIVNEAVRLKLIRSPEGITIAIKFVGLPRHFSWQNIEFIVAATIKGLREMAGRDFRPMRVGFYAGA
jgi:hypothetical protein